MSSGPTAPTVLYRTNLTSAMSSFKSDLTGLGIVTSFERVHACKLKDSSAMHLKSSSRGMCFRQL
jgi:hypothetical protein